MTKLFLVIADHSRDSKNFLKINIEILYNKYFLVKERKTYFYDHSKKSLDLIKEVIYKIPRVGLINYSSH